MAKSPSQARQGLATSPGELDIRIRRIEDLLSYLARLQGVNINALPSVAANAKQTVAVPPAVAGVKRATSSIGGFTITWDELPFHIQGYEIEVANNSSFSNPFSTQVIQPQYTFLTNSTRDNFYVRVRGIGDKPGHWSEVLETTSQRLTSGGLILADQTFDLSSYSDISDPLGGNPASTDIYEGVTVATGSGIVEVRISFAYKIGATISAVPDKVDVVFEILRNNQQIDSVTIEPLATYSGVKLQQPNLVMTTTDIPTVSQVFYSFRVTVSRNGSSTIDLEPIQITYSVSEGDSNV